jgi:hypothetical protein
MDKQAPSTVSLVILARVIYPLHVTPLSIPTSPQQIALISSQHKQQPRKKKSLAIQTLSFIWHHHS